MDVVGVGARFRAARIKKGWRQRDVAVRARVSRSAVSRIELGKFEAVTLKTMIDVGNHLGIRIDWKLLSFDGDLDRLVNARHGALHESVARTLLRLDGVPYRRTGPPFARRSRETGAGCGVGCASRRGRFGRCLSGQTTTARALNEVWRCQAGPIAPPQGRVSVGEAVVRRRGAGGLDVTRSSWSYDRVV